MGNWGENLDYRAKALKEYEVRFSIHFLKIFFDVDRILDSVLKITDKHPKDSFMKLWAGNMLGVFLVFLASFRYFALPMTVVFIFYMISLIRVYMGWRKCRYSRIQFWLMSILTMTISLAVAEYFHYILDTKIL